MGSELELDFESTESNEVSLVKKCPHLSGNINIGRVRKAVAARKGRSSAVKCQEKGCQAADLLWLCLQCGQVHCGRSENNHAELHSSSNPKHCLVINPSSLDVWCYACDDFLQSDRTKNQIIAEVKALFAQEKAKMERKALAAIPVPSALSTGKPIKSDKDIKRARAKLHIPGLSNLGNTCFFNSTVQCLAYTKALEPYWGNQDSPEAASVIQKSLSRAFLNLINVMHAQRSAGKLSPVVSPVGLFTQLKQKYEMYRSMVQQDAHELLRTLLDGIREEQRPRDSETGKLIPDGGGGFVDDVFGGKL
ncbi:Ubiquitin carboxyl-terminal hydrolase 45, partial [Rhizoclosmatium sp. JEL0117]